MFCSEVNIHINQQRIIIIAEVLKMKSKHPLGDMMYYIKNTYTVQRSAVLQFLFRLTLLQEPTKIILHHHHVCHQVSGLMHIIPPDSPTSPSTADQNIPVMIYGNYANAT